LKEKYGYSPSQTTLQSENRMSLVYNMLRNQTTQDGKKLNIIRIPLPECQNIELDEADSTYDALSQLYTQFPKKILGLPASSYGNFLLANNAIVIAQYAEGIKDKNSELYKRLSITDKMTKDIFNDYYKGKMEIIGMNNLIVNFGGGGFNCTTCDQPLEGLKELPGFLYEKDKEIIEK
jgi:agmatine deiminase